MFLGYKISDQGVTIDESRIDALKKYPKPKTPKQVKQFLGLAGYYRQFIPNFSSIVNPITQLTKKSVKFVWNEECDKAFSQIIEMLSKQPILAYPDFKQRFYLSTDASKVGVGAVLSQMDEEGRERPIYYASRSLNGAERNYSTIERELLAIVYAVEKFRYYLLGKEFTISTDHNPLTYLNNLTLSSSRLTRWRLKLAEYDFKIKYKKGQLNNNADALSRIELEEDCNSSEELIEHLLAIVEKRDNVKVDKIQYMEDTIQSLPKNVPVAVCVPSNVKKLNGIAGKLMNEAKISSLKRQKLKVGECFEGKGKGTMFFLCTRNKPTDKPSYDALEKTLVALKKKCKKLQIAKVAFAKIECGLDKLQWSRVKSMINEIIIDQIIECLVYSSTQTKSESDGDVDLSVASRIRKLQRQDQYIKEKINDVENKKEKSFVMEDGVLLKLRKSRRGRIFKQLVVPEALKEDIFKLCHDNFTGAHLGEKKTWVKLNNRFFWPNAYKETISYVQSCPVCAKLKNPPATRANLKPIIDFDKPFDKMAVDILELSHTNSGNKYVVVFSDYLTKWAEAFPLRRATAEEIAKIFVNEIIARHSAPRELLSDQGANFCSSLIKNVCEYFRVNKIQTTPYNPKCDGLVERFNKTLCKMLAAYSNSNQTNWDLYLPLVLFAYRTSEQSTSKESPFALLYGREPRLPSDLDGFSQDYNPSKFVEDLNEQWREAKRNIIKQAEVNKESYDSKYLKNQPVYKEGDEVRVKQLATKIGLKRKLRNDLWSDAYKITKVVSPTNVEIQFKNKTKVINVNNIKKKELNREVIRDKETVTRFGRVSKPRFNNSN